MLLARARIDRTAGQVYNVGGGPTNTISIWAELCGPLQGLLGILPAVDYGEFRPGDQRIYVSDIRRVKEHLNWTPRVSIMEGLRNMIEAWEDNGTIPDRSMAARSQLGSI